MFAQQGQDTDRAVARALTTHHSRATARALRPFRAVLGAVAVTATALVAVTAAAGGTAASAAVASAHPAHLVRAQLPGHDAAATLTGVTWNPLSLVNGWQSSESAYHSGDPAWAVKNGMVYLSGSMNGGNNFQFATLPAAARPAHILYITVYTYNGSNGYLVIYPDGTMEVSSTPISNAVTFTSLAGVSFPAATTAATPLSLLNGWQSANTAQGTGDPAYAVSGGVVHLSGSVQQPSGTSAEFAVLPTAARPAHQVWLTVYSNDGTHTILQVLPNGEVGAWTGGAQAYTSLAGVSYPAAAVSQHKLTLLNGWQPQPRTSDTGTPSYEVTGGVVYLSGSMHQPTGSNKQFAVLPVGARPVHSLYLKVFNANTVVGVVQIDPNGHMSAWDANAGTAAHIDTSLDGISYPVNS
jgi:hypothetical protein